MRILSRPAVASLVIDTNQAGTPASPWGMQSDLQRPVGVKKAVRGMVSGWIVNRVNL